MCQLLQKFKSFGYTGWQRACLLKAFILFIACFSFLGLGGIGLSGCAQPKGHSTSIQLSTWGSAQEIAVLKNLLAEFERKHPAIRVELLHIPENYYQKLHILLAGNLAPDVIFTNSISFPIYAEHGVFRDLRPFLAEESESGLHADDFYTQALAAFEWTDDAHSTEQIPMLGALPRDISNVVVFYNRDSFRRASLPEPKPDWTWVQFLAAAHALTEDTDRDGVPERFGVSFYAKPPLFWLPFVWSAGGYLFSEDFRRLELAESPALEGLQFYADLRNRWHVAPKKAESGGATMSQLFLQEKLAMMVNGRWSVPVLREQARFDWDVVPLPIGPSGKSRVGIDASGYAISSQSAHPAEAFALIRFLLSKKALQAVTESGLIIPARPDVAESVAFLSPGLPPQHGRVFLDVIPEGVPTHTPPRWNEFSEELQLMLEPVWDGKQQAAEALETGKPRLQRLLESAP